MEQNRPEKPKNSEPKIKCRVCGSEKFILDQSFGASDKICGSCGTLAGQPSAFKDVTPKPDAPKLNVTPIVEKKNLTPDQLLRQWQTEGELAELILIGIPKTGGWKFGTSNTTFEFFSSAEAVVQKLKLDALMFGKK